MSGLIAHNRDDLEELKRRGDRNYYEFKVTKSKTPQRVGPVQVTLNKTDQKKGKYTMTVFVDDRSIEKKDKTAGEPVQFYLKGSSRMAPYEIVVFDVGKNDINGYLSTPKDAGSGTAPTAAPARRSGSRVQADLQTAVVTRLSLSHSKPCSAFWKPDAGQGFCLFRPRASMEKLHIHGRNSWRRPLMKAYAPARVLSAL